jgi:energy-coupling factor transporter ATP-binding protein EcfA2
MPIKQVEVKAFKSIVNQTVDLGQLNIFIGTNGAGKSNFLEAVGVLSCAVAGQVSYSKLAERGIRLSAPEVFKSSFRNLARKNAFSLKAQFDDLTYSTTINPNNGANFDFSAESIDRGGFRIGGRSNRGITFESISITKEITEPFPKGQSVISVLEFLGAFTEVESIQLQALKDYAIYAISTPILRGVSSDDSHKEPLGLYGGSLSVALKDVMDEIHATKTKKHDIKKTEKTPRREIEIALTRAREVQDD